MENYRFHLEKYHRGSKTACPECKRKACFTRYVDESGDITFPSHVGKCDHENSCGYHYTPKDFFREHPDESESFRQEWKPQAVTPKKPVSPPSFMDSAVMQRSLSHHTKDDGLYFGRESVNREIRFRNALRLRHHLVAYIQLSDTHNHFSFRLQ